MPKTILYHSHGGQKYHDQTRYSVLTLLALLLEQNRNDFRIAVYTDRPDQLPAHDLIRPLRVGHSELVAWRGPLDFVHRIKLEVLRRALGAFGGPLIYVDSDTRWLRIPDEPFAALSSNGPPTCYLYKAEGPVSARFHSGCFDLLRKKRHALMEWHLAPDPPWIMWNAGTVGLPSRSEGFIDETLRLNDELLLHASHRTFVEQLSLSLVAASRFEVRPFDAYLEHWWSYGSELPILLPRFFDSLTPDLTVREQAALAAQFPLTESDLRAIQVLPANRFARWRAKIRNSFYKRKIDMRAYALRRRFAAIERVN
jgi:hypothetical protein